MPPVHRILAVTVLTLPVSAADYHVDAANGSDQNPGNAAAPWQTLTHAFAQPLQAGDRVLIEGTFAAPLETFPLSPPPGIDLLPRPGTRATIDGANAKALHVERPGRHDGEIAGAGETLTLIGTPAIHFEAVDTTRLITMHVTQCHLVGDVLVSNVQGTGVYTQTGFEPTLDTCSIEGDVRLQNARPGTLFIEDVLSARIVDCSITGDVTALEPETRGLFVVNGNRIGGELRFQNALSFGCAFELRRNRVEGGDLDVAVSNFSSGDVIGNTVAGNLMATVGVDDRLKVEGNRVTGDLTANAYYVESVSHNTARDIQCSGGPPPSSFARVNDNTCTSLRVNLWSPDGLEVDRNRVTGGGITLDQIPNGGTAVRSNVVVCTRPTPGISIASPLGSVFGITVQDNDLSSALGVETGLRIDGPFVGPCTIERNVVSGFATSFAFSGSASTPWPLPVLSIEHNEFHDATGTQVDLDLRNVLNEVRVDHNTLAHSSGGVGLRIARSGSTGPLQCTNNVMAFHAAGDVEPLALQPSDDVRANLARDGSLDAFHPTNLHGDPQFVASTTSAVELAISSPGIGGAIDPASGNANGDVGARQSVHVQTLQASWPAANMLQIRVVGRPGTQAILLVGVRATPDAFVRFCDGWIGIDTLRFAFAMAGFVAGGTWDSTFQVPPVPFTVTFQSVRDIDIAQQLCGMTNTLIVRR